MIKIITRLFVLFILLSCSEKDPILKGHREPVFKQSGIEMTKEKIVSLPNNITNIKEYNCPYTQDSSNIIWKGNKKIFSGFPTSNFVKSLQKPTCDENNIYVGLTTGEVVKISIKNHNIEWVVDIYKQNSITTNPTILDITAPIVISNNDLYVSGLANIFCKLNKINGTKKWCINIGTGNKFLVLEDIIFLVSTDNIVYALNKNSGKIFWKTNVKELKDPIYKDKNIIIGKEKIDAMTGLKI